MVDDWEGSVIQPFTDFINRVFSRSSTSIWLRLCLISRLAAPEVCARVAIRSSAKDGSDCAESLAGSRASTPSTARAEPLAGSRVGTPSTAGSRAESLAGSRAGTPSTARAKPIAGSRIGTASSRAESLAGSHTGKPSAASATSSKPARPSADGQSTSDTPIANTKKISQYEIDRLYNIARNRERLAQLGIQPLKPSPPQKSKERMPRKKADPIPESERRCGRSAGTAKL